MIIRNHINVKDDLLLDGLRPVVGMQFISPVFALSLIVYLARCGKQVSITNTQDYLNLINLHTAGIKPDQMRQTEFLPKQRCQGGNILSSREYHHPSVEYSA